MVGQLESDRVASLSGSDKCTAVRVYGASGGLIAEPNVHLTLTHIKMASPLRWQRLPPRTARSGACLPLQVLSMTLGSIFHPNSEWSCTGSQHPARKGMLLTPLSMGPLAVACSASMVGTSLILYQHKWWERPTILLVHMGRHSWWISVLAHRGGSQVGVRPPFTLL